MKQALSISKRSALLLAWICTSFIPIASAHPYSYPPLNSKSFAGIWEGIVPEGPRVFVISVDSGLRGAQVAMGTGPASKPDRVVFRAYAVRVHRGGSFLIEARDKAGFVLKIRGRGWAAAGSGRLKADVEISANPTEPLPTVFDVDFRMMKGGYIESIHRLAMLAHEGITGARPARATTRSTRK